MKAKEVLSIKRIFLIMMALCLVLSGCSKAPDIQEESSEDVVEETEWEEPFPGEIEPEEEHAGPIDTDGDGLADFYPLEYCQTGSEYMMSPLRDELSDYEIVSNIIPASVSYEADGTVYFSATGPDGSEVRFWGYDIEPSPEGIKFNTKGRMISLDSFGRVYSLDPILKENFDEDNWCSRFGVFDLTMNMHPGSLENMGYHRGGSVLVNDFLNENSSGVFFNVQPYFFGMGTNNPNYEPEEYENPGYFIVLELRVIYRPESEMQPLRCVMLNPMNYGCYVEGDRYEVEKEGKYDWKQLVMDFDLIGIPDVYEDYLELPLERFYIWDPMIYGYELSLCDWTIGELRDASGEVLDKEDTRVTKGMTLDVTLGGITYAVPINVIDTVQTARTQHELQIHKYPIATGDLNILCIPFSWSDERDRATDELYEAFCKELGRVSDMNGNVKDYSDSAASQRFSLSEYMDIASYGKFHITTYITDWYPCEMPFSEMKYQTGGFLFWDLYDWLQATYPGQDWNQFDGDGDHYFDAVIFLNAGDMSGEDGFDIMSFSGGVYMADTYGANEDYNAEYNSFPRFNSVVYCHSDLFANNTLIHEFGHNLGLIDYYDVTYSGIDAVGGYDMQDAQDGDWNAFSKYSVGWIDPIRVTDLASGESVEYEIAPMASSGDAIMIPAAGDPSDTPFGEYMLVDLFANVGTNIYDAPDFGLSDVVGVRIYHVDALMEARDFLGSIYSSVVVPIGTAHYGNDYKESGKYELELIQAGGTNTFTQLGSERTVIDDSDFFQAGDTFTTADYAQFFDGGMFDSGKDFGYSIEVVSITGTGEDARAVIRITRQ